MSFLWESEFFVGETSWKKFPPTPPSRTFTKKFLKPNKKLKCLHTFFVRALIFLASRFAASRREPPLLSSKYYRKSRIFYMEKNFSLAAGGKLHRAKRELHFLPCKKLHVLQSKTLHCGSPPSGRRSVVPDGFRECLMDSEDDKNFVPALENSAGTSKFYLTSKTCSKVFEGGVGETFFSKSFPHKNRPTQNASRLSIPERR